MELIAVLAAIMGVPLHSSQTLTLPYRFLPNPSFYLPAAHTRKVNKLVREPKASTKGDQHFTDILAGQSGRCFVGLAVKFERVRWSGR